MPFLEFIQLQKRRQEYLRANLFRSGNPCTSARAFNRRFVKWGMGVVSGRTGQCRRLIYRIARPVQLADCNRDSNRAPDVGCHASPRGVRLPRSSSSAAIARTLDPLGTHYFDCQKLICWQPGSNDGRLCTLPIIPQLRHIAAQGPLCPCATNASIINVRRCRRVAQAALKSCGLLE